MTNAEVAKDDLDTILSKMVRESTDTEKIIDDFHEVMKVACEKTFRRPQAAGKIISNKSIP